MIPLGIVASQAAGTGTVSGDVSLDFINGVYVSGGNSLTAGDVLGDTGRLSEDGVSILGDSPVSLLGDARDRYLTANWTTIIEFEAATPEWAGHRLFLLSLFDPSLNEVSVYTQFLFAVVYDSNSPDDRIQEDDPDGGAVGINRIAATRTDDRLAVSINGNASQVTLATMAAAAYNSAEIASHNGSGNPAGFIRVMEIIDPVDDSELPTLSSLV